MDGPRLQFLTAVLGEKGAGALAKATVQAPELEALLVPRAVISWLGMYAREDFDGAVPGVEGSLLQFTKSEDLYSGSVSVGDSTFGFVKAPVHRLGACMAVALGATGDRPAKEVNIQALGKSIDVLVKARGAVEELRKRALEATQKAEKKTTGGAEAPGPAHAPTEPDGPLAPIPPTPTQTSKGPIVGLTPKPPKLPTPKAATDQIQTGTTVKQPKAKTLSTNVTKSEAARECGACGSKQFREGVFTGCMCFRVLAKSVATTTTKDGFKLEFGSEWGRADVATLFEAFGRR